MTTSNDPADVGVLVVDDDEQVLNILGQGLTALGFRVTQVDNGMAGVDTFRQKRGDIDVVLLDVRMPGLDGPLTLQALKRLDDGVRVVFMTSFTGDYEPQDLMRLGAVGYLTKPFTLADLADTLRKATRPAPQGA